jgi:FhuF 2Fe-2S C-terminal domain
VTARALAGSLAELGPYFAIETHEPAARRSGPWLPLAGLLRDPAVLTARIEQVRSGLAAAAGHPGRLVDVRVAASVAHLGVTARLLAPALGAETLGGALLLEPDQVWWVPELGGPFRLSAPAPGPERPADRPGRPAAGSARPAAGSAPPVPGACRDLLAGPVTELVAAVAGRSVSPRILWGNVASAISGAATMIAAARPDLAGPARAAAATALQFPALAGAADGLPGTPAFRRRSCCLIYRLSAEPAAALCGDCVLASRPGRARSAR